MALSLSTPEKFNEGEDLDVWLDGFEVYLCALGIEEVNRKRALLLHLLGTDIQQKLKDVPETELSQSQTDVYESTKVKLRYILKPQVRTLYERNIFHNMTMTDKEESIRDFVGRLKRQAEKCDFSREQKNELIRDIIISRCPHPPLQVRMLEAHHLTTDEAVKMWESFLQVRVQARKLQEMNLNKESEPSPEQEPKKEIDFTNRVRESRKSPPSFSGEKNKPSHGPCYRCGRRSHKASECWATKGKTCNKCGGKNHFAKMCKSRQVDGTSLARRVHATSEDVPGDFAFTSSGGVKKNQLTDVQLNGQTVKVLVDTGASADIIARRDFQKLSGIKPTKTSRRLLPYGSKIPLKLNGEFLASTAANGREVQSCWLIAAHGQISLLSGTTAELLGLISTERSVNQVAEKRPAKHSLEQILDEHKEIFEEKLGQLADIKANLKLKEKAEPVFKRVRPVPYALQEEVNRELKKWEDSGIAEKIEYSDWGTPLVVVPKPGGGVRLCGDYKCTVNPQLAVPKTPMPSLEDILTKLAGMHKFCKLDLSTAYLQMQLDEDSQQMTVLNTPRGLLKMKRLPYGISASPAIFQSTMEKVLEGLPGVTCFLDDVLVAGATESETLERLDETLKRLKKWKLVLKRKKCQFMMTSIQYLGVELSGNGVRTVKEKVDPVLQAPRPQNSGELRSFLGAVTFYARFVADMSKVAAPLHRLLHKGQKWKWTEAEEDSFNELKQRLAQAPVLAHYDGRRPVRLITDASPHGLGAVLMQVDHDGNERPVRYASRSLTKAEKNYAQVEREGLAVIFGVTRFKQYLWGRKFTLVTDNKPLTTLLGPKIQSPALAAARMQRWALILAAYTYDVEYRKAEEIPMADFLSRLPVQEEQEETNAQDEASVCFLEQLDRMKPLTCEDIRRATRRDRRLSRVVQCLHSGWSERGPAELQPFESKKSELSVSCGCVFWGNRVVIPESLRREVLKELHDSHPGISRMKMLARSYVWWPGIDDDIKNLVSSCPGCQAGQNEKPAVFLHPWEHTRNPWERLHLDFAGPFRGCYFLVVVDSHSKWPEIVTMKQITAESTICELSKIFARWGIPVQVVTDNGAQLTSKDFEEFMMKLGIKHIRVAPYRPQSNGLAERMVQTVKKNLKACLMSGDDRPLELQLSSFLMGYRNTPHSMTGVAPAESMLGRIMRTRLDLLKPRPGERIMNSQAKQMENASKRFPEYRAGDPVLVRNYAGGPKWKRGHVTGRTGPVSYQVTVEGLTWSRHAGQLLPLSRSSTSAREENVGSGRAPDTRSKDKQAPRIQKKDTKETDPQQVWNGTYTPQPAERSGPDRQENGPTSVQCRRESADDSQSTTQDTDLGKLDDHPPREPERSEDGDEAVMSKPADNGDHLSSKPQPSPGEDRLVTRSGREVRKPIRFQAGFDGP